MFNIKKDGRFDTTEMLLWNIWQELKVLNKTEVIETVEAVEAVETVVETVEEKEIIEENLQEKPKSKCKKCGIEFENKGQFLAHTRICKGDGNNVIVSIS